LRAVGDQHERVCDNTGDSMRYLSELSIIHIQPIEEIFEDI